MPFSKVTILAWSTTETTEKPLVAQGFEPPDSPIQLVLYLTSATLTTLSLFCGQIDLLGTCSRTTGGIFSSKVQLVTIYQKTKLVNKFVGHERMNLYCSWYDNCWCCCWLWCDYFCTSAATKRNYFYPMNHEKQQFPVLQKKLDIWKRSLLKKLRQNIFCEMKSNSL